jgi:hypothetical protein
MHLLLLLGLATQVDCPATAQLAFEAALSGRRDPLRGFGALIEWEGQQLLATPLEPWLLEPEPSRSETPPGLLDWSQRVQRAHVHLSTTLVPLGAPARGGLDEWWSTVLLLDLPELEAGTRGLLPAPELPLLGDSLCCCPPASPDEGSDSAKRTDQTTGVLVPVLELLREPGVPAVELLCGFSGSPVPQPGQVLLDREGRAVALVSAVEAGPNGTRLRAQCLGPLLALPPLLNGARQTARVEPGIFTQLSSDGRRVVLGASVFAGTRALAVESGSLDEDLASWSQYQLVRFSPDGLFLVGLHPVRGVQWCDAASLDLLVNFSPLESAPDSLEFSPDGARLFAADLGPGGVWELGLGDTSVRSIAPRGADLLAVGPGGRWLALGERWTDASALSCALRVLKQASDEPQARFEESEFDVRGQVLSLAANPIEDRLAYSQGTRLSLAEAWTGAQVWSQDLAPLEPRALCFSATGRQLWVAPGREVTEDDGLRYADGCALLLLDAADGRVLARSSALSSPPVALTREPALGPAGVNSPAATPASDGILALCDNGQLLRFWPPQTRAIAAAEPMPK